MKQKHYAAIDCGNSNGKLIDITFDGSTIQYAYAESFPFAPVTVLGSVYNDFLHIHELIQDGLTKLVSMNGSGAIRSVGITTWGSNYGLINQSGLLTHHSFCSRDRTGQATLEEVLSKGLITKRDFFRSTGTTLVDFCAQIELLRDKTLCPEVYNAADCFLATPSLLSYFLSGEKFNDTTMLSTACLLRSGTDRIDTELLRRFGLRTDFFPATVAPATRVGKLAPSVARHVGDAEIEMVACAGHDTPSGLIPIRGLDAQTAFISMGTVMLVGTVSPVPDLSDRVFDGGFRVVRTADSYATYRDIQGFWILNHCMKGFSRSGVAPSFDELEAEAGKLERGRSLINLNCKLFYHGGTDMVERIMRYCGETGQHVPQSPAEIYRCLIDSYALAARSTVEALAALRGEPIQKIKLFNGGSQCDILGETISECTGCEVESGIRYATALGCATLQMLSYGEFDSMAQLQDAVAASFPMKNLSKKKCEAWDDIYRRYRALERLPEAAGVIGK